MYEAFQMCYAEFILDGIESNMHLLSFFNTEMLQVDEILPRRGQKKTLYTAHGQLYSNIPTLNGFWPNVVHLRITQSSDTAK